MSDRSRRRLVLALALAPAALTRAFAADAPRFDAAGFRAAQQAGKPVLVDIYATW